MSSYDILMIVVIIGSIAFGAWKGMAWQLASLGSLVLSYFMALQFSDKLAPSISMEAPWNRVAAMLILYACTAAAVWIVFRFVAKVIDGIKLREFDRQLGALFGGLKGARRYRCPCRATTGDPCFRARRSIRSASCVR